MLRAIDLRTNEPRSAREELSGVKLLARIIDKGRAAIVGMLGPYLFFDCPLDRVFFEAVNATQDEFLQVLQNAFTSNLTNNAVSLADLRESPECEPEISDERFLAYAEARDADNAVIIWLLEEKHTPPSVVAAINDAVNHLPPEAFVDWAS